MFPIPWDREPRNNRKREQARSRTGTKDTCRGARAQGNHQLPKTTTYLRLCIEFESLISFIPGLEKSITFCLKVRTENNEI